MSLSSGLLLSMTSLSLSWLYMWHSKGLGLLENYYTRLQLNVTRNCENSGKRCRQAMTFFTMVLSLCAWMKRARMSKLMHASMVTHTLENMQSWKMFFLWGDQYSLVATLTVDGYIASNVVPGSFDFMDFLEFIQEMVVHSNSQFIMPMTDSWQFPQMNPYPEPWSVLVLDNCRIHHNKVLVNMVRAAGCLILFLPAYSPDLNPIEESFSTSLFVFHIYRLMYQVTYL